MRGLSYAIDTITGVTLGQQGESLVTTIEIDCTAWLEDDPDLELHIVHIRHGETVPYIPATTMDTETGMTLLWPVTAADTGITGTGVASVIGIDGSRIKKSRTFRTKTGHIVPGSEEETPPSTVSGWVDGVLQAAQICVTMAEDFTQLQSDVAGKQDQLTFDATPTADSTNPVESQGIKTALDTKDEWIQTAVHVNLGESLVIKDAAAHPLLAFNCNFEPYLELNGFDKPWAPGSGTNKVNLGETYTATDNTTIATLTLAAGTYTMSATVTNSGSAAGRMRLQTSLLVYGDIPIATTDSAVRKSVTFTLPSDSEVYVVLNGASSGYDLTVSQVQIESGNTMTDYVPYANVCDFHVYDGLRVTRTRGSSHFWWDVSFSESLYGGTYYNTGRLVSTHSVKILSGGFSMSEDGVLYLDTTYSGCASFTLCNMYENGGVVTSIANALSKAKKLCWVRETSKLRPVIYDPAFTSAADFNAMISNTNLKLLALDAISTTVTVDALDALENVYGTNTWTTTPDTYKTITYKANTKLYIDTRIADLQDQIDNL